MENVGNSMNYLSAYYTFKDLGLSKWAKQNRLSPDKKAVILKDNQLVINSADYGSAQSRKRVVAGEIIKRKQFVILSSTHKDPKKDGDQLSYKTLNFIKENLPKPNVQKSTKIIHDPLYPNITIKASDLTDHFYDTGLYTCEWRQSKFLKTNHPYMGIMSFPENETKPSRTITATKIGTSREALIYKSEFDRKGDGEYRTPTVREAASIMGFPITYQFKGSEGTKWRLVGNAVCPSVSRALAKQLRIELGLDLITVPIVQTIPNIENIENLNTYSEKRFNKRPKRIKDSRCRRHPFKDGNLTVTLSNYDIEENGRDVSTWMTSVQYGNGEGFPIFNYRDGEFKEWEQLIRKLKKGDQFLAIINNGFSEKIGSCPELQEMYELQRSKDNLLEPTELLEEAANIIEKLDINDQKFIQDTKVVFRNKSVVPAKQLFALYAINKISSIANGGDHGQR